MIIGKRLNDRYEVLELIGGGGMANVYLAHDVILKRDVAVKVLRFDHSADEQFIKRFRREAHSATALNHPNVVMVYDVGETDDVYYIVMEYVKGSTLKQYIQKTPHISLETMVDIMLQLTSAIAHAHACGLIHRDIKPQNILVNEYEQVKVADFGIALASTSTTVTQTNSVLGSVHYLSPEQARGGISTQKTDIYSLGIVMYELITGNLPFSGETSISVVLKQLQEETPSIREFNASIPQSIENVVLKATAKNPFYRYNSMEEMESDLRTVFEPNRRNETKFTVETESDEETRAIPIIRQSIEKEKIKTQQTKLTPPPVPKKKSKLIPILITLIVVLAGAGISIVTWVPTLFAVKDITIPDVTNKSYDEATKELKDVGLIVEKTTEITDPLIIKGNVIKTEPAANQTVKEGSNVTIFKSLGKEAGTFQSYIGEDIERIRSILTEQSFKNINQTDVDSEEPKGTIIEQDPAPNSSVIPEETTVIFKVSKGPTKIVLKDLMGYTEKSVQDYGTDTGLAIKIKTEYSETVVKGMVISQTPRAASELGKGEAVQVTISLGEKPHPNKTVMKVITIPYGAADEPPVNALLYIEDATHNMTKPYQTYNLIEDVQEQVTFTIEYGKEAGYRIIVNGKVVKEDIIAYPTS